MSTFNKLYCHKIYHKGILIDAAALKGEPGKVLSTSTTKGKTGASGKLNIQTIEVGINDFAVSIPNYEDSEYDVIHIIKKAGTTRDVKVISVVTSGDNLEVSLYKDFKQEVTLYRSSSGWVF